MTKNTRTVLFIVFIILFLLAAPAVVFYSQGYRFDFKEKKTVQIGAFYFKVLPKNAEVYLNGKFKKKTSIFTHSALVENLLPKIYEVEIKKEGYHSWNKNLAIKEKQVTEAKNIVLIPEKLNFTTLAKTQKEIKNILAEISVPPKETPPALLENALTYNDFKISPNGEKIAYFNNYEIWVLFLENQYDQPQKRINDKLFLTRFSEKIEKVFWLTNHYLIFNIGDKIKVVEIDDRDKINIVNLAEFASPEIIFNKSDKKLYVLSNETLYVSEALLP